ncbi:prib protein [Moniliophthora roreri MCA 2997]|uniref:Prib protein n=2 Tax=Moniliophthora roreri TaxID=221103 RepID=V2X7F9_MONRO|nr:prib protein [Moniliophthora roreri MCA 2997]KAI3610583.1 prib protein [Moniliophthora roreri]
MDQPSEQVPDLKISKPPVVRGARACTTCRAAKMKCVGAEDGQKQCQRCKRAGVDCIFEKHRRGRKPGSKLSEASKMLRRLEKGLNSAKLKSQANESSLPYTAEPSPMNQDYMGAPDRSNHLPGGKHFPTNHLPPLNLSRYSHGGDYPPSSGSSRTVDMDEDDDNDRTEDSIFPVKLINRENRRNFFRTILNNPEETPSAGPTSARSASPQSQPNAAHFGATDTISDPVSAGLMDEDEAKLVFDLIFLRLNPFINLFDPSLHSFSYVRKKSPFLFTVLLMAGCKFFKPELFIKCQKLANELAIKAFAEGWKSVETVQAFACLTYWRDETDNRTWTYIGYACRMAVELNLNRYVSQPPLHENDLQMRERRNRERTYLILFVHDRSLSTQTGRNWMLPEDEFTKHSINWHDQGGGNIRPEDVIVAAFVQLRHIATETTEAFRNSSGSHTDINYEVVLRNCNGQLTMWAETWQRQMQRAGGDNFHYSFLTFFRLYVRLFTNSFGVEASISGSSRSALSVQALSVCYTSAIDSLQILSKDFATMGVLRYSQDSVTMMSAYAAVVLLKYLRNPVTAPQLPEEAAERIHAMISKTADAYYEASVLSPASSGAAYHARFLRKLVANDISRSRRTERHAGSPSIDPRLQGPPGSNAVQPSYSHATNSHAQDTSYSFSSSGHGISHDSQYGRPNGSIPTIHPTSHQDYGPPPQHASKNDEEYWKNMLMEIGFGGLGADDPYQNPAIPISYGH